MAGSLSLFMSLKLECIFGWSNSHEWAVISSSTFPSNVFPSVVFLTRSYIVSAID